MEQLAVSPWNLKPGEKIDLYVATVGNCEMSNPTRAYEKIEIDGEMKDVPIKIEMIDVWENFVKPEPYEDVSEEWDYLETGELPICVPSDDWNRLKEDGTTEYELWYSIGGINDRFRKIVMPIESRCYTYLSIADDTPYVFFIYIPKNVCDIESIEDFIKRLPGPD
jgi:hypothetical protein